MRFSHRRCLWKALKNFLRPELNPHKILVTGQVSPTLDVPDHIVYPDYVKGNMAKRNVLIDIKSDDEITRMKEAGKLAKHVLAVAESYLRPGISTDEIDKIVHDEIIKSGAYPSPLFYKGFPKSCCTSVNNVVCHGIPDDRQLISGDIINVDVTVYYRGCHGDTSDTFVINQADDEALNLISVTRECVHRAIDICKPGTSFRKVGEIIEAVSKSAGYSVCRAFIGHGIGSYFHGPPDIFHYATTRASKQPMEPGMVFTIEPILMEGSSDIIFLPDGWTVVSKDGGRAAQTELTVLVTKNGCEVLT